MIRGVCEELASFITIAFVPESRNYESKKPEKGGGITSPVTTYTHSSRHAELNFPVSHGYCSVGLRGRVFGREGTNPDQCTQSPVTAGVS